MIKKSFVLMVLLFVAVIGLVVPKADAVTAVVPDTGLKEAINDELGEPATYEPTIADIESLTTLTAFGRDISNLEGLQHAINLEELILNGNEITEISLLSGLVNIEELSIAHNSGLSDITPLNNLNQLTYLSLEGNNNIDIAQLSNFVQLEYLSLRSVDINDINPLSNLTNLTMLDLAFNNVKDLTPIKDFTNLQSLSIRGNNVSDLSQIDTVISLLGTFDAEMQTITLPDKVLADSATSLTIDNPVIASDGSVVDGNITPSDGGTYNSPEIEWTGLTATDTERSFTFEQGNFAGTVTQPIKRTLIPDDALRQLINVELGKSTSYEPTQVDLESLTKLRGFRENIADLEGLQYAINLEELTLSYNQFDDLTPISGLTSLKHLNIDSSMLDDISAISGLTNLISLDIGHNQISKLTALNNLTNLTELRIQATPIDDLTPLSNLTNLTSLYLMDTDITDLSPISSLTNLTELTVNRQQFEDDDIQPIFQLPNLTYLSLNDNNITDLSRFTVFTDLEELSLVDNKGITDIQPLESLDHLEALNIAYLENLGDAGVAVLEGLTQLKELNVAGLNLSNLTFLRNMTDLVELMVFSNNITDLTPIKDLQNLKILNVSYNSVSDLSQVTGLINRLDHLYAFDQEIILPAKEVQSTETSLTLENQIMLADGSIVGNIMPNDGGTYQAPNVTWTGLTVYETDLSYAFDEGQYTGTVTQPLKWNHEDIVIDPDVETEVFADQNVTIRGTNVVITTPSDLPLGTKLTVSDKTGNTTGDGMESAGKAFSFNFVYPANTSFSDDFTLVMGYETNSYTESQVDIYYYNPSTSKWEKQNGHVDSGKIMIHPAHFSTYGVFATVDSKEDSDDEQNDDNNDNTDSGENDNNNGGNGDMDNDTTDDEGTSTDEENELPNTATPWVYQLMLLGLGLLVVGGGLLLFRLRQSKL
ncbi:leucine-rich repeat domain-containing protein [Radiobacillus sp. PE A8.2]|uniref:leucine-rich repeat domain-containing protein n=1 Tax=Radiobacillus sp. PE A8.2 TaxID=3380349 RepID=UPI00388F4811